MSNEPIECPLCFRLTKTDPCSHCGTHNIALVQPSAEALATAAEIKRELRESYCVSVTDNVFEDIITRHDESAYAEIANLRQLLTIAVDKGDRMTEKYEHAEAQRVVRHDALKSALDAIESHDEWKSMGDHPDFCVVCRNRDVHKPTCKRQIALAKIKAVLG